MSEHEQRNERRVTHDEPRGVTPRIDRAEKMSEGRPITDGNGVPIAERHAEKADEKQRDEDSRTR
jgi:hypothetical protein